MRQLPTQKSARGRSDGKGALFSFVRPTNETSCLLLPRAPASSRESSRKAPARPVCIPRSLRPIENSYTFETLCPAGATLVGPEACSQRARPPPQNAPVDQRRHFFQSRGFSQE